MRINVNRLYKNSDEKKAVFRHWVALLAQEYSVDHDDAMKWVYDKGSHEFIVTYLKSQGWHVDLYETPLIENRCLSYGFVLNDECEQLMKWRLSVP